ncbi:MAG: glutathione peroxidase [Treponema sp.]|jgi:glutathione peroxidase|nr:glutathione peroxidase [Treponema sp.]HAK68911.1 glutathione peroxidase [Treponema sp.]HBB42334.1 glutathione peroxidase [Treponema sp.]
MAQIYDFTVKDGKGNDVPLKSFSGKVMLIVNTATGCGFTPQYEGLEALYRKYHDKGLEILDFPCNQFGKQAPGSNEEITQFCTLKYHTTFPQLNKIEVNGENADPLYKFLKEKKKGLIGSSIKWNFTKFLVDRQGNVVERFAPTDTPAKIDEKIAGLL